ncbi:MAG: bifunctional folylpolyglutamate synthase/dihydrofolate synthase [Clostridia bacterium]|nr:bifunctional folylpolyglutamate synthase/dihydrofolate synthase [Clostridia bacterium]
MTVEQALGYIHSVSWMGSRPGLGRTRELLALMGNPQNALRFVHVAGTNGKGSTSAMIASILRQAGYKVGLYTSPYILRFNERMQVNGTEISDTELAEITEYVKPFAESMQDHPTEFELVTAIGFEYFARQRCDIVVLEVGLGGELDSTNVITPVLSVITEIDFDHMGVLGNTIEEIAEAKAGIIKNGVPVVSADNLPAAAKVVDDVCKAKGSLHIKPDFECIQNKITTEDGISFVYNGVSCHIPLLGEYQYRNALMAITAVHALNKLGFKISDEQTVKGLARVKWAGRFEKLCDNPVFIYDGGHNPQGVAAAAKTFSKLYGKGVVLMGVMADKDYDAEIKTLIPLATKFVTVTPSNPRALPAAELAAKINSLGGNAVSSVTVEKGVALAAESAQGEEPVFALGSLYMYGEIKEAVKKLFL